MDQILQQLPYIVALLSVWWCTVTIAWSIRVHKENKSLKSKMILMESSGDWHAKYIEEADENFAIKKSLGEAGYVLVSNEKYRLQERSDGDA